MQSFDQLAQELLQEMLPPVRGVQTGTPGLKQKLQFSEEDLMDPQMQALLKQAKGDPMIMAKMRPKIISTLRNRRVLAMKTAQDELRALK